ncbi:MAG: Rpn family recombination-promoting nuclease/putative transposase, partial [Chlamydiota bacterium]
MPKTQTIYHSPHDSSITSDSTRKSSCKKEGEAELPILTQSKYLDPRNDIAFKNLFGSEKNKGLVIHFLNDLVVLNQGRQIKTVSFLPCVQDAEIAALKQSVVDILCLDERGEQYIIEMQYAPLDGFIERAQHYASRAYSSQMERGEKSYKNIKKVIFVAITNEVLFPEEEDYKSKHDMRHDKSLKSYLNGMTFYFIELPKFKKTIEELLTLEEKWLFILKHATETTSEEAEKISGNDPIIHQAYEALDRFSWSKEELLSY